MFGNPFSQNVSATQFPNEKCRWCLKRIGLDNRYPIPLCDACFVDAYKNNTPKSPKGNLWERAMSEFRSEAKTWVKRVQKAPTHLDSMTSATEALGDVIQLRLQHFAALKAGDTTEARRIELEVSARESTIKQYQQSMPALISDLEKES